MMAWVRLWILVGVLAVAGPSARAGNFEETLEAAKQGSAADQYWLGISYGNGLGVEQNWEKMAYWYQKAADQGYAKGQNALARLYEIGNGVEKDYEKASYWRHKAANQGYGTAQFWLGMNYINGKVAPRDYVEAYKWLNLAAAQSNNTGIVARGERDRLEKYLTPDQISEGQRRTREWRSSEDVARAELPGTRIPPPSGATVNDLVSTGSGFMVNHNGHILTNNHVVTGCPRIKIASSSSVVKAVAYSEESDLALLSHDPDGSLSPVRWRDGSEVRLGEDVVVAGYPLQGILTSDLGVTAGTISALSGIGGDWHHLQITAPVQPGNSGGPLLDRAGRVSGIVVAELNEIVMAEHTGDIPQNVGFAIRSSVARAFMDAHGIEYVVSSDDDAISTADIAEEARSYTVRIECWK